MRLSINNRFFHSLAFDLRSLAAFRILLGLSIAYNLFCIKFSYALEIWGKHPIIPQKVQQRLNGLNSFSIFDFIRNDTFVWFYFAVCGLVALAFILGFKLKYTKWVLLFLFWNLLQANSAFSFGFDFFTFQLLFWACFLPVDANFSIEKKKTVSDYTIWSFLLLFQICWVYFSTGWAKYGISWQQGFAVRNMLLDEWAVNELGKFLADKRWFYLPATYISLYTERFFPLLVFFPFKRNILLYVTSIFLLFFHLSIFLTYSVGNFSISGIAVAFLLLPGSFWEKFGIEATQTSNLKISFFNVTLPKKIGAIFCVIAAIIITQKNVFFLFKYSSLKENKGFQETMMPFYQQLDIPNPVKTSFFIQFWKMFAPNPPVKAGWITLEKRNEDGTDSDVFTNKKVPLKPTVFWRPKGMEYYLMMYARNFDFPDNSGLKFKVFIKYWIPYALKRENISSSELNNIIFADYLKIVAEQTTNSEPNVEYKLYKAADFVNANYQITRGF